MLSVSVHLQFLQAFYQTHSSDQTIGRYSAACLHTMRLTKVSARRYPSSSIEIAVSFKHSIQISKSLLTASFPSLLPLTQAVKNLNPLICRFYFLDGKAKAMGVNPSATAGDVIRTLAEKIELQNVEGWALYEVMHRLSLLSL